MRSIRRMAEPSSSATVIRVCLSVVSISIEVVVLVDNLVHNFQLVCFDVFFEHVGRGVSGDLHDVINIHSGEVHQGSAGAPGRVRVNELIFLIFNGGFLAALGLDHFHDVVDACPFADILDVAIDDLVGQVRHLVVVALEDGLELRGARNGHLGAGLVLADVDVHNLTELDFRLGLPGVIRIGDIDDGALGVGLDGVAGYVVVSVRLSASCPGTPTWPRTRQSTVSPGCRLVTHKASQLPTGKPLPNVVIHSSARMA